MAAASSINQDASDSTVMFPSFTYRVLIPSFSGHLYSVSLPLVRTSRLPVASDGVWKSNPGSSISFGQSVSCSLICITLGVSVTDAQIGQVHHSLLLYWISCDLPRCSLKLSGDLCLLCPVLVFLCDFFRGHTVIERF